MKNEIQQYFEEYKNSLKIDFIKYEDAKVNVTLSASKTLLKKQKKEKPADVPVKTYEEIKKEEAPKEIPKLRHGFVTFLGETPENA